MKRTLQNGFGLARHTPWEAYVTACDVVEAQIRARSGPDPSEPYEGNSGTYEIDVATQLVEELLPEDLTALFMVARAPQDVLGERDEEERLAWNESAGWLFAAWIESNPLREDEVLAFALTAENRLPFLFALSSRRERGPLGEEALRRLEDLTPRVGVAEAKWLAALLLRRGGPQPGQWLRRMRERFPEWDLPRN